MIDITIRCGNCGIINEIKLSAANVYSDSLIKLDCLNCSCPSFVLRSLITTYSGYNRPIDSVLVKQPTNNRHKAVRDRRKVFDYLDNLKHTPICEAVLVDVMMANFNIPHPKAYKFLVEWKIQVGG